MAIKTPKQFFSKVQEARQLLREQALIIYELFLANAKDAQANGDHETAHKAYQWLLEHIPADDDGTRMIDISVDKKVEQIVQDTRPAIQIGINLGGVKQPKALKGEVIDAE